MLDDKEVVLAVDVATWANDHILGRKASTLSSPWCPFNDRELFTSLSPESLLFEHGESNRFTTPSDGVFNSVTELMYPCGSPFGSSVKLYRNNIQMTMKPHQIIHDVSASIILYIGDRELNNTLTANIE
jgi:hypothetical protein